MQKYIAGALVLCVAFFGLLFARVIAKPATKFELKQIPEDQKLTRMGYAEAYPLQFNSYKMNMDKSPSPTGFGGADAYSHLTEQPEQIELFKGYKFSIQYDDDRGHWYAGEDILNSKRRPGQLGSCIVCKGSYMYDVYFKQSGWEFASKPFDEVAAPIKEDEWFGCSTCHDPDTMKLRVYNQGFVESMAELGIDVNKATHNEMRAYVCGQCHNEYYFKKKEDGRVHMPFANGLGPEEEWKYYHDGHDPKFDADWIHPDSGAAMLKVQHPDFEVWADSVHALNGVTCVDCHMPYVRKDGQKYTSHWMTNPLKHYDTGCAKCHDESYETMLHRVQTINDNTFKLLRMAGQTTARAHKVIKAAHLAGATDEQLAESRQLVREAQWYWDWVSAESAMGFHNPDKCMKALGISIDAAHRAIESATAAVKGGALAIEAMPTEPFTDTKFPDAIKPGAPAPAPAAAPTPAQ